MEQWWNDTDRGKPKYCEKACPRVTLSTVNPTLTGLRWHPDLTVIPYISVQSTSLIWTLLIKSFPPSERVVWIAVTVGSVEKRTNVAMLTDTADGRPARHSAYAVPVFKCVCSWPHRALTVIATVHTATGTQWSLSDRNVTVRIVRIGSSADGTFS